MFLNRRCVIVTNNRKLMARYVVGHKAVPLGQAADCPHHGHILCAGCHCWLWKAPDSLQRTSRRYKGTLKAEFRAKAFPDAPSHALCPAAVGQPKPEAFVQVWFGNTKGTSTHTEVCYCPCLRDRQRDSPPFLNPWLPHTRHWEKKMLLTNARLLFEKQG